MVIKNKHIVAFHGTFKNNFQTIKKNNFELSKNTKHYLGKGIYFFLEDFAKDDAKNWTEKKKKFQNKKNEICVIEAQIVIDDKSLWDLTNNEKIKKYQKSYQIIVENFKNNINKRINTKKNKTENISGEIIDLFVQMYNIEFVKSWTYTAFDYLGENNVFSALPNTCELCVKNNKYINLKTLKIAQ